MINIENPRKLSPTRLESSLRRNSNTIKPVEEKILYLSKSLQLTEYKFEDENGRAKTAEVIRKRFMIGVNKDCMNQNDINDHYYCKEDTILSMAILKRHCLCDCLILVRQYRPTLKSFSLEFPARIIEQHINNNNNSIVVDNNNCLKTNSDNNNTTNLNSNNNHNNNNNNYDLSNDLSGDLAMKEIEENTGYGSTTIKFISPNTATDPELSDGRVKLVSMIIDGDDPIKNNIFRAKKMGKLRRKSSSNNNNSHNHSHNDANNDATINYNNDANVDNNDNNNNNVDNNNDDDEDDDIEIILLPINGLLDRLNEYNNNGTIIDSRVFSFAIGLKIAEKLSQTPLKPENIEIAI